MPEQASETLGIEIQSRPPTYPDITTKPELGETIVKGSNRSVRRALQRPGGEAAVAAIKEEIAGVKKGISEQFPDYPEERVEALLDITFGFGRLKKENVLNTQEIDIYQKEVSARIQHALAHEVLSASQSDNPDYVATTYTLVRNLATVSEGMHNQYGSNINMLWKGMRNELAILKVLHNNDFRVFLPDYAQDTAEISDRDNEVLQLDVKSGVDLIALSPDGKILLIDAKGRKNQDDLKEIMRTGKPKKIDPSRGINPLLAETIVRIAQDCNADVSDTYRMMLVLDTQGKNFEPTDFRTHDHRDTENQRQSLKKFTSVKPDVEVGILDQLNFTDYSTKNARLAYSSNR